jgi:hypothetical protein
MVSAGEPWHQTGAGSSEVRDMSKTRVHVSLGGFKLAGDLFAGIMVSGKFGCVGSDPFPCQKVGKRWKRRGCWLGYGYKEAFV